MTVEPLRKFVPVTVRVKAAPPATAELGLSEEIVAALIARLDAAEAAPPGFFTVIARLPEDASEAVGTVAVIDVAVPAVTTRAVEPMYGTVPAVNTPPPLVVPAIKLVPVTVITVSPDPATTELGLNEVIAGALTVRWDAAEAAPPGFCTVMLRVAAAASDAVGTVAVIEVAVPAVTVRAVEPR
jgi:hypothetical protein